MRRLFAGASLAALALTAGCQNRLMQGDLAWAKTAKVSTLGSQEYFDFVLTAYDPTKNLWSAAAAKDYPDESGASVVAINTGAKAMKTGENTWVAQNSNACGIFVPVQGAPAAEIGSRVLGCGSFLALPAVPDIYAHAVRAQVSAGGGYDLWMLTAAPSGPKLYPDYSHPPRKPAVTPDGYKPLAGAPTAPVNAFGAIGLEAGKHRFAPPPDPIANDAAGHAVGKVAWNDGLTAPKVTSAASQCEVQAPRPKTDADVAALGQAVWSCLENAPTKKDQQAPGLVPLQ